MFTKAHYGYDVGSEGRGSGKEHRQKTTESLQWWNTVVGSGSCLHRPVEVRASSSVSLMPRRGSFSGPKQCVSAVTHTGDELRGPGLALTIYVILVSHLIFLSLFSNSNM